MTKTGGTRAPMLTQAGGVFSLTCGVELAIQATTENIWKLLTYAEGFPRWNSTVTGIEGEIREGKRLRVHVPGTDRTFTPTVSDVVPNVRMTWTGGFAPLFKGVRVFELKASSDGSTEFAMQERFSGLMLPFVKSSLPDFRPIFERYAMDLSAEAELRQQSQPRSEHK